MDELDAIFADVVGRARGSCFLCKDKPVARLMVQVSRLDPDGRTMKRAGETKQHGHVFCAKHAASLYRDISNRIDQK